jgi:hypothetical protein
MTHRANVTGAKRLKLLEGARLALRSQKSYNSLLRAAGRRVVYSVRKRAI